MKTTIDWKLTQSALVAAFSGALAVQVLHESCHALAAVLVGAQLKAFNLFAVLWEWRGAASTPGALIIEANPALVNIATGLVAAFLFQRGYARRRPMLNLFLMYFAGYSVFMGFGYLLVDPLFYQPGGESLGDWKKVIDMLGGSWAVRIPILLVGAAGVLWGFFWLARAALRFARNATDSAERVRVALPLLLVPYLSIALFFSVLSLWNPMGAAGIFVVTFQYWFGTIGFFWAFFLAAYWLDVKTPNADPLPLPEKLSRPWAIAAACAALVAIGILLPTIWFG